MHQEMFPKRVILMSQNHPKAIIKIKSNPQKVRVKKLIFLVNLQIGETLLRKNAFHRILWVRVSPSIQFSVSADASLKNLKAKIS